MFSHHINTRLSENRALPKRFIMFFLKMLFWQISRDRNSWVSFFSAKFLPRCAQGPGAKVEKCLRFRPAKNILRTACSSAGNMPSLKKKQGMHWCISCPAACVGQLKACTKFKEPWPSKLSFSWHLCKMFVYLCLGRWLSPSPLYSILFRVSSAALKSTYDLHM